MLTALTSSVFQANASTVFPPSLNPGDTYRIVFVTSTTRNGLSSVIGDYNAFVTTAANADANMAALGTTWSALASTATVDARANAGLSVADTTTRFYNTLGQLVATGVLSPSSGLFAGYGTTHSGIITDPGGSSAYRHVWTGSTPDGTADPSNPLGILVSVNGYTFFTDYNWAAFSADASTNSFSLYGVSALLTIPATTPEPGTSALVGVGLAGLLLIRLRRKPTQ